MIYNMDSCVQMNSAKNLCMGFQNKLFNFIFINFLKYPHNCYIVLFKEW